jgi:3,4-dihydroxy 2-butanone 4-phosphate synthase/GTP cyclohydrolase II
VRDLGIKKVRLLSNNPRKSRALTEHGVEVVAQVACKAPANPHSFAHLPARKEKKAHAFLNGGVHATGL